MKKELYYSVVAILFTLSCNPPDNPIPVIDTVTPEDLHPGSEIIIEGRFLNGINAVFLNEVRFDAFSKGSDSILAKIPSNIPVGLYSLYVMSSEEKSNIIKVTITPAKPVLNSISPSHASVNDTLIISGYYFENNQLEIHIEDLVFSSFIEVNDSIIKLLVTDEFKSGQLTVVNAFGSSMPKPFNFDEDVNSKGPKFKDMNPMVSAVGDTVTVTGSNFKNYPLSIVFPVNITLQENIDFKIISDSLLTIRVPQGGSPGNIHISNEHGSFDIEIDVVDAPVISLIRPKSNPEGGPMLIYGKNLEHVEKIEFGDDITISATNFTYFSTSEGEEIIALRVPKIQPREFQVRLTLEGNQIHSETATYTVLDGSMELPVYLPSIVLPNPPQINILSNLNNQWLHMDQQSRIFMGVDSESHAGQVIIIYNSDLNAGTVNKEDNSITLSIDSKDYYGKLDNSFANSDKKILRLILTPIEQGNQIEMVFPYFLESLTPESVQAGDSITLSGRYFKALDSWAIQIGENISVPKGACRIISDIKIKLEIPSDIETGNHDVIIYNEDEFLYSNSRTIEIVSK